MNTGRMRHMAGSAALLGAALLAGCQEAGPRTAPGRTPAPQAMAVQPGIDASTYFAHGHLLERQANLDRAIEQYELALRLNPDFVAAHNRLGVVLNKKGEHAAATARFRDAVAAAPNQAYLHNNLGFSLFLEQRYDEALPCFERALELNPGFGRAQMNRGLTLGKLGRFEDAYASFAEVCSDADAHYNLAMLQTEGGMYVDAVRSLDQALVLNPKFEPARRQLHVVARLAAEQEAAVAAEREAALAAQTPVQSNEVEPASAVSPLTPTPVEAAPVEAAPVEAAPDETAPVETASPIEQSFAAPDARLSSYVVDDADIFRPLVLNRVAIAALLTPEQREALAVWRDE